MKPVATDPLSMFCESCGVPSPLEAERIRAGRNSEVLLLRDGNRCWVLKHYFRHASDLRDRLGTEFGFLKFLQDCGVSEVPRPLAAERTLGYGLYSFLPGTRPREILPRHITQAADFVQQINRHRANRGARELPQAADACASWQDHIDLTDSRLERLLAAKAITPLEVEARVFVKERLQARWLGLKRDIAREVGSDGLATRVEPEAQILSPSDFGFHNTLEAAASLSFVDFEYAGWDDPAKLICDFMCQPELPVSSVQGAQFCAEVLADSPDPDGVSLRVQHLLPVHRLKWCCILLNEFKLEDRQRRSHAGVESEGLLASQLGKAKQYFDAHFASTH